MKKIIYIIVLLSMVFHLSVCNAAAGTIAYVDEGKNLLVIATPYGYTCAESYSSVILLSQHQKVFGELHTYAIQTLHVDDDLDTEVLVFIEEIFCNEGQVLNWLRRK